MRHLQIFHQHNQNNNLHLYIYKYIYRCGVKVKIHIILSYNIQYNSMSCKMNSGNLNFTSNFSPFILSNSYCMTYFLLYFLFNTYIFPLTSLIKCWCISLFTQTQIHTSIKQLINCPLDEMYVDELGVGVDELSMNMMINDKYVRQLYCMYTPLYNKFYKASKPDKASKPASKPGPDFVRTRSRFLFESMFEDNVRVRSSTFSKSSSFFIEFQASKMTKYYFKIRKKYPKFFARAFGASFFSCIKIDQFCSEIMNF